MFFFSKYFTLYIFNCIIVAGRGVPRLSPSKGGFLGSVHTDFGTFTNLKQPKLDPNTRDDGQEDDDEDQYEFVEQYNNRPRSNPYYHQHPHRTRRPSNINLLYTFDFTL